jgi:hypothetical protein
MKFWSKICKSQRPSAQFCEANLLWFHFQSEQRHTFLHIHSSPCHRDTTSKIYFYTFQDGKTLLLCCALSNNFLQNECIGNELHYLWYRDTFHLCEFLKVFFCLSCSRDSKNISLGYALANLDYQIIQSCCFFKLNHHFNLIFHLSLSRAVFWIFVDLKKSIHHLDPSPTRINMRDYKEFQVSFY